MTSSIRGMVIDEKHAQFRLDKLRRSGKPVTPESIAYWWLPVPGEREVIYDQGLEVLFMSLGKFLTPAALALFQEALDADAE